MPQVFNTPNGPALLVRHEDRGTGLEYCFAIVKDRTLAYRWHKTLPDDFELVHDPGSRAEANVLAVENGALVREKAVLIECLASALGQMDERCAEQVRAIYRAKIKTADLVSLTKPSDLIGASKGG